MRTSAIPNGSLVASSLKCFSEGFELASKAIVQLAAFAAFAFVGERCRDLMNAFSS